jgi:hypothetical protein
LLNRHENNLEIMGNSGWCMSKEVEYRTGEAYRARNLEFQIESEEETLEQEVKMDISAEKMEIVESNSPVTDNEVLQVRF